MFAFYSDDLSPNPAAVYDYYCIKAVEKHEKEAGEGPFKKNLFAQNSEEVGRRINEVF